MVRAAFQPTGLAGVSSKWGLVLNHLNDLLQQMTRTLEMGNALCSPNSLYGNAETDLSGMQTSQGSASWAPCLAGCDDGVMVQGPGGGLSEWLL